MDLEVGDLVRQISKPEFIGIVVAKDDMGYFIMNYRVLWPSPSLKVWYRLDELEKIEGPVESK